MTTFFDKDIKERQYEGENWKQITDEIVSSCLTKVHLSFDIDGLDPKFVPNTELLFMVDLKQIRYIIC